MTKKEKTCIVCGDQFIGNAHAETCGTSCRKKLSRLKTKGGKPEFDLIAKAKENNKPENKKRILMERTELKSKVKYTQPDEGAYDSPQPQPFLDDEIGQMPLPKKSIEKKPFINDAIKKRTGLS